MTEEQKKIKKYVNTLERNLRIPLKMKARINEDIGTEIHLKLEEGKSIDDVLQEMGNPEEVAERFNEEFSVYPPCPKADFPLQNHMLAQGRVWYQKAARIPLKISAHIL